MPVSPDKGSNPLLDGLRIEPTPEPTTLVISDRATPMTVKRAGSRWPRDNW